jgi:hypothetical protein
MHEAALRDTVERIREARAYSITLDYWTASNGNKFLSITYHWTDDNWNICAQTLDLVPIEGTDGKRGEHKNRQPFRKERAMGRSCALVEATEAPPLSVFCNKA